jgi:glycerol-3-phosphate dehydrogenase
MRENDRLTLAVAAAADRAGAELANYVEALGPASAGVVRARDVLTGDELEVRAAVVINTAGAGAASVMRSFGVERRIPLVRAMNLVMSRPAGEIALAAPGGSGRMLTLVPWRQRAIVGTGQGDALADEGDHEVTGADVERLVADANRAFPALALTAADVALVHRGLVPARLARDGTVALLSVARVFEDATPSGMPLLTVVGTKYTTARAVAEEAVTVAARRLRRTIRKADTDRATLPGAAIADHEGVAIETARREGVEVPPTLLRHLVARYADAAARIVSRAAARPELLNPLAPGCDSIGAEVVHAIHEETAVRLTDIVLRRTTVGAAGDPGEIVLRTCAALAAGELRWSAARVAEEIAAVQAIYRMP